MNADRQQGAGKPVKTMLLALVVALAIGFALGTWLGPAVVSIRVTLLTAYLGLIVAMQACYLILDYRN